MRETQTPAYRRPASIGGIIKGAIVLCLLILALLFVGQIRAAIDPDVRAAQRLALLRQQELNSRLDWLDTVVAAGWRLLPLAAAGSAVYVGLTLAWRRWGWRESIHADKIIALTRAQYPALPRHLQTYTHHEAPRALAPAPVAAQLPEPSVDSALPGALDLASLALHPTRDRILLAVDASGPITVALHELCHAALLGSTGGGKSNLLRLLIPQLQAVGAQVALADPHYAPIDPENGDDWRPIAARLAFQPAVKASEIDDLLNYFTEELARRLEKRNKGEKVGPPLFFSFDELPVITDLVPDAPARLGKLLREGRKVQLLTCGASQSMLIKEVGGSSALRDQYRTAFYVGGDRKSASAMLDIPERLIDDGPLGQGVVLLRSKATSPAQLVRVPYVSNESLYRMLGDDQATVTLQNHDAVVTPVVIQSPEDSHTAASDYSAAARPETPTADDARVISLFLAEKDASAIVTELTGMTSKNGAKYLAELRRVQAVLRAAMRGAT